ncbi:unnamed protein product [Coregonus sp. 'balchen']|nr:unnamed protein product [Coregonus sp. 'balchen']
MEEEDEEGSTEEQEEEEEEDWEKALSVERFGDIITESAFSSGEKMGRNFNEKDFECKPVHQSVDFYTDHRHTFHHTHHPLSTHLPPPQRLRKRVLSMDRDRRRKKKRKKKKTSMPPSEVTPTIHEVDEEEEAESESEGWGQAATPTEQPDDQPQFSLGSEEDLEPALPFTSFHMESEHQHLPPEKATLATAEEVVVEEEEEQQQEQEVQEQPEDEEGDEEFNNRWAQQCYSS